MQIIQQRQDPPGPVPRDRRRAPRRRIDLEADVMTGEGDFTVPVRDVSLLGLFLQARPASHPELKVGANLDLMLWSRDGVSETCVICTGQIVRVDPGLISGRAPGFAVALGGLGQSERILLGQLLRQSEPRGRR